MLSLFFSFSLTVQKIIRDHTRSARSAESGRYGRLQHCCLSIYYIYDVTLNKNSPVILVKIFKFYYVNRSTTQLLSLRGPHTLSGVLTARGDRQRERRGVRRIAAHRAVNRDSPLDARSATIRAKYVIFRSRPPSTVATAADRAATATLSISNFFRL